MSNDVTLPPEALKRTLPLEYVIAKTLLSFFLLGEKWGFLLIENDRRQPMSTDGYELLFAQRMEHLMCDIVGTMSINPSLPDNQAAIKHAVASLMPNLAQTRVRPHEDLQSCLNHVPLPMLALNSKSETTEINGAAVSLEAHMQANPAIEWERRDPPKTVYSSCQERWILQREVAYRLEQLQYGLDRDDKLAAAGIYTHITDAQEFARKLLESFQGHLSTHELGTIRDVFAQAAQDSDIQRQAPIQPPVDQS